MFKSVLRNVWQKLEPEDTLLRMHYAGFLQVSENWKKSGNLSGQGKVRGNSFWKSRENEKLVKPDVRF